MTPAFMQQHYQRKADEWAAKAAADPDSRSAKFWAETYAGYAQRQPSDEPEKDTP